jgi:hypothetical protein
MEIRKSIEEWIASKSEAKLCLHNGFAGFSFGCPSNPIFLDKDYAIKIIEKVIETEHKSLKELLYLDTVSIENVFSVFPELEKIGYRYIGLNIESECLYGDAGLG